MMKKRILSIILAILLLASSSALTEGILPALQTPPPVYYTISLHSATGAEYTSYDDNADGGRTYYYKSGISYECYLEFSRKLGEAGYKLVSSETLEDGTSRAVVSDGKATLTIDYNLNSQKAVVTYPPYVYARSAELYDDYTELKDGDRFELASGVMATVEGWSYVDFYAGSYGTVWESAKDSNYCILFLKLDYCIPDRLNSLKLMNSPVIRYENSTTVDSSSQRGIIDRETNRVYYSEKEEQSYLQGQMRQKQAEWALVFKLTDARLQNPETVSITFRDNLCAKRYVYHLTPIKEEAQAIPEELVGAWKGVGTPKNGGTSIDLAVTIEADGSGEYTFAQGKYTESYPFTVSHTDNTFAVDIPATSQMGKVEGTYALEDGVLKLDITTTFTGGGTYSYTAECKKKEGADTEEMLGFAADALQSMLDSAKEKGINLFAAWKLSDIDPQAVRKAAVITASDEQVAWLDKLAQGDTCALAALSYAVNSQFSKDYAVAAAALAQTGEDAGLATDGNIMLFVVYDYHICLCLIRADGSWESVLMMSDKNVLAAFSEEYIRQTIAQVGLPGEVGIEVLALN